MIQGVPFVWVSPVIAQALKSHGWTESMPHLKSSVVPIELASIRGSTDAASFPVELSPSDNPVFISLMASPANLLYLEWWVQAICGVRNKEKLAVLHHLREMRVTEVRWGVLEDQERIWKLWPFGYWEKMTGNDHLFRHTLHHRSRSKCRIIVQERLKSAEDVDGSSTCDGGVMAE
ncbi:uncharacterized protein BDR25DRAFT_349204 [Lindgomyces ingoldianus]|uniref:Uncharacterized protein n=1 Tax=Lindgomyces ingoldianus TaxID=673940 RepID=A0ACB6RG08_9PLEO|nr:uncharacterized protein BDR25DRAFT_349204 [Lindgomyces ingoldianus]KAF2477260.1 hypothetical protein BDR25DRAFT_349204 [Lindgomyces ingoldianus]